MYDIVAVGSATRDALVKSEHFKVFDDARFATKKSLALPLGSKISIKDIVFTTGGAGTNTAVTFARLGLKTACLARVGFDVSGETVLRELKHEKVDTRFMETDHLAATAYSIVLEPAAGERTILTYRGANEGLTARELTRIPTRWIYLSSISANLGILKSAILAKKKFGTRIAWNPGGTDLALGAKKLRPHLKYIDVFIANKEEVAELVGLKYDDPKVFCALNELVGGLAVMTMGPEGVMVSDGKKIWRAGTFKEKKMVDRTGAGDAFGSGFVSGLLLAGIYGGRSMTEKAILEALRVGAANATSKVEHIGAKGGLITKRELKAARWKKLKVVASSDCFRN
ncbi:MAG: carbohydrate kinase family protein [Candidatus Niyogibacteria bacterium]|nr:carbohydrate kinase family protein [Candidatus Niyogibacteria bacterium]